MKVNRFKDKSFYKCEDRSILHKFLKEEGYNRKYLALDLGISVMCLDKYLKSPELFRISHLKALCEETDVDPNFILSLIYDDNL